MCILIFTLDVGATDKTKGSDSASAVAIAVPVVLLVLLIPAVLVAVFFYRRYAIHWCATVGPDYMKCVMESRSKMRDEVVSDSSKHCVHIVPVSRD